MARRWNTPRVLAASVAAALLLSIAVVTAHASTAIAAAQQGDRVDLALPVFSDPTSITNPYFPISTATRVIQLGEEGGKPLRAEVTLLPETRTIAWNGQQVETLVSQYVAYLDGRLLEAAWDYYAQDDSGSVWYFGEDVDNYIKGKIDNHDGAWLAGRHGPPGMIMPADPQPGDVYRPENIPGLVFEEVVVESTTATVDGPSGSIDNVMVVTEHLMDGTTEEKHFAPGYGEFIAKATDELLTLAVAVPTDTLDGDAPAALTEITDAARRVFDDAASVTADDAAALGRAYDGYASGAEVPKLLDEGMKTALHALGTAIAAKDESATRQAANDVARAGLDLFTRYESAAGPADVGRLQQWARQLLIDSDAHKKAPIKKALVRGDAAALDVVWARVLASIDDGDAAGAIGAAIEKVRIAAANGRFRAAATAANTIVTTVESLGPEVQV